MPAALTLEAPAKINLWLRVVRRRDDGFHEIETRIAPLELADEVRLEFPGHLARGAVAFSCDDDSLPEGEANLAVRAVRALEKVTGLLPGVRIQLKKNIPHGAGLGGGSSDAAAVLSGLTQACAPDLEPGLLVPVAASLGSDVPFFLQRGVGDGTGRGEIVTPVVFPFRPRVLLLKLPFAVATARAYQEWHDSRWVPGLPSQPQWTPWGSLTNDLERPVFARFPILGHLKARLLETPGIAGALMSGSGSTVFALLEEKLSATEIVDAVHDLTGDECWWCDTRVRGSGQA